MCEGSGLRIEWRERAQSIIMNIKLGRVQKESNNIYIKAEHAI